MTTCFLCKKVINPNDTSLEKATFYGYFYHFYHYHSKETCDSPTFICLKCHNAWYFENKPIEQLNKR